jgi:hypothetical protein
MLRLPIRCATVILRFAPLFFQRSWRHAEVLLIEAILAPGQRTVTSVLRITGLVQERHFKNYRWVLSRAVWSTRAASSETLALCRDDGARRRMVRHDGRRAFACSRAAGGGR